MISKGSGQHDEKIPLPREASEMIHSVNARSMTVSTRFPADAGQMSESLTHRNSQHDGSSMSLMSYMEALVFRRRFLALCVLFSVMMGWIALLVWPRTYASESKMMLRVGRETVGLDPTATTTRQTQVLQKTQEEEVNVALDILGSRQIAEQVVDEIGVDAILSGSLPSKDEDGNQPQSWMKTSLATLANQVSGLADQLISTSGVRDKISDHERAINRLRDAIDVHAPKKSTAITVSAESKTPEMAQAIVRSLTEHFLIAQVNVSKTDGSFAFFEKQTLDAEDKLNKLLQQRTSMLQVRQIASIESRHAALALQLGTIESSLLDSQSSLKQYKAEIEDLMKKADDTEDEIVAAKQMQSDPTFSGMRTSLYATEMEEKRLAALYKPGHPQLEQVRNQVAAAKEVLENLDGDREDKSTTPNPAKTRIEEDLQKVRTKVVGLESLVHATEAQRDEKQKEIRELLDFAVKLSQVDRDVAIAESSLRLLQEKLEEARVLDDLQSQKISSVSVFQPATFAEKPVSPKKPLVAAAFAMLGLFGGIGWVFLREFTSTTLRTAEQVEKNLDYSVIATIPRSRGLKSIQQVVAASNVTDIRKSCTRVLSHVLLSHPPSSREGFRGKTIGVLSVIDGCGASSVAVGLALASSEDAGLRTTLIDFDLTKRTVSNAFGLNGAPGFAELLTGEAGREDCTQHVEHRPLGLISGSSAQSNRRIEADPKLIIHTLNELLEENDIVIVDLPPASRPDQTHAVAQHLDQILIVIESEKTELAAAKRLVRQLELGGAGIVGIILNKSRSALPRLLTRLLG
jgi:polysaccharide biosynthesis transport protein